MHLKSIRKIATHIKPYINVYVHTFMYLYRDTVAYSGGGAKEVIPPPEALKGEKAFSLSPGREKG